MPSGGNKRRCRKRLNFRPRRTSRWTRSGERRRRRWPVGLCWQTPHTAPTPSFATDSPSWGCAMPLGVQSSMTVWDSGKLPLPAKPRGKIGRPPRLLQRSTDHPPVSVKQVATSLPSTAFKEITRREGRDRKLRSRFAAVRVRPAHRDYSRAEPHAEEWLLIEWPAGESEPPKYWFSTLPADLPLTDLIHLAKHRWIIERDYQELKQELGLGHFEGRGWRGFHHHATLCIVSYGFLVSERTRFSPSARAGQLELRTPKIPSRFRPRGAARPQRTAPSVVNRNAAHDDRANSAATA